MVSHPRCPGKGWSEDRAWVSGLAFNQLCDFGEVVWPLRVKQRTCFTGLPRGVSLYNVSWEAPFSFTMRLAHQYKVRIRLHPASLLGGFGSIFLGTEREKGILALSHLCHPLSSHPAPKSVTRDPDLGRQRAGRGWGQSKKPGAKMTHGCGIH